MNTLKIKNLLPILFISFGLFLSSCQKEDIVESITEESEQDNETEELDEETDNIMENVYLYGDQAKLSKKTASSNAPSVALAACATITDTIIGTTKTVTIDFGTSCTLYNGAIVSGIIEIVYNKDTAQLSKTITGTFINFYYNNKSVTGSKTITRVLQNANGNPQSTIVRDITITWPNNDFARRDGTKVREWIVGAFNGIWGDNVYEITGNWTNTYKNGNVHTGTVVIPIRREVACNYLVSGSIDIVRTNYSGTLDFGTGNCDNQATFTGSNGTVYTINL